MCHVLNLEKHSSQENRAKEGHQMDWWHEETPKESILGPTHQTASAATLPKGPSGKKSVTCHPRATV